MPALASAPELTSQNGMVTLGLQAAFDSTGRPAFFYNGKLGAPTLRVKPGDMIHLQFTNSLPQFCAVGVVSNSNLHFHGLNSSPLVPGDEIITTNTAPGQNTDYVIAINPDQAPGLYWYHPHPHNITAWEVGNGMSGAIVVEGIGNAVPQTAGLRERIIILRDIPGDASFATGEGTTGHLTGTPTINGATFASIGIKPGETELFRVINASGQRHYDLSVDGAQIKLIGYDGVPFNAYPGSPQTPPTLSDVVIPPAGRAEFLVTPSQLPAALISRSYVTGPEGAPNPQVILGQLADDSRWPQSLQQNETVQKLASYAPSRFYNTTLPAPVTQRTMHFQESTAGFLINGQQYNPTGPPNVVAKVGTVEEWTLENDTLQVHDFHIHQAHFLVESINGTPPSSPQWRDVVILPSQQGTTPSVVKVLMDFRDPTLAGTFVFHCHIVNHEDTGMMLKIQLQ